MFCYSNDGHSMRRVETDYVAQAGESLFPQAATEAELSADFPKHATTAAKAEINRQLWSLEISVTPRRLREAMIGKDNGWLAGIDAQIDALRAQLKVLG